MQCISVDRARRIANSKENLTAMPLLELMTYEYGMAISKLRGRRIGIQVPANALRERHTFDFAGRDKWL